jgi:hypothetical protein
MLCGLAMPLYSSSTVSVLFGGKNTLFFSTRHLSFLKTHHKRPSISMTRHGRSMRKVPCLIILLSSALLASCDIYLYIDGQIEGPIENTEAAFGLPIPGMGVEGNLKASFSNRLLGLSRHHRTFLSFPDHAYRSIISLQQPHVGNWYTGQHA